MAKELIFKLGGVKAVADALNVIPSTVANWNMPDRDIPWKWRPAIARLAKDQSIPLPHDFYGEP